LLGRFALLAPALTTGRRRSVLKPNRLSLRVVRAVAEQAKAAKAT